MAAHIILVFTYSNIFTAYYYLYIKWFNYYRFEGLILKCHHSQVDFVILCATSILVVTGMLGGSTGKVKQNVDLVMFSQWFEFKVNTLANRSRDDKTTSNLAWDIHHLCQSASTLPNTCRTIHNLHILHFVCHCRSWFVFYGTYLYTKPFRSDILRFRSFLPWNEPNIEATW